jgi:two-component system cell cycle sensor histidine kinase/response regulator CckA
MILLHAERGAAECLTLDSTGSTVSWHQSSVILSISSQKFAKITGREPAWARYSFAVAISALAIAFDLVLDRIVTDRLYPFFPAVAAIIATAACAGTGPGFVTTALMVIWSAFDLSRHGISPENTFLRCGLLLVEGVVMSVGGARLWRSMRKAAFSEAWHRQLVETAAEGIWVHDEKGVITYANARISEMLGVTVENLIGTNVDEFFMPEDLSMERIRAANLRSGRKEQFDRRLRRGDGSEMWVLSCSNLIVSEAIFGETPGSLAMMTNITERKRAEYALRRSEERFRNLFEGVLEGVYQSTPDGRILAANPMLLKMLGLANEAEMNDVNIAHDLYVDPYIRHRLLEQLEQEGGFQNVEYELRRRDGKIITVLENARVLRDENGAVLYYEGTLTDITPRKRIEEQLRQAQKVEALGRLAGSVANDFNNVLTIITGFAQLALSDLPPSNPAIQSIDQVLEAADHAMALTTQLLLFSRRQAPAEGSLDLNRAIERSEAARQAGLAVSLSREPAPVYARQKQIEPIVRTLSDKVRRSFPSASLAVKTELSKLEEKFCGRCGTAQPGPYAVLSIGNLSGGAEVRDIFADPDCAAMQAGESAAMGLAATHATVAQCGGFIVAIVATAGGTAHMVGGTAQEIRGDATAVERFHVFLPCAAAGPGEEPALPAAASAAGETILLVEDEPLIRELSRDILERQGYRVILASNAKEAEQIGSRAGSFDLLITDAVMPNITGAELARRLRAAHPGLKVLFISGYADGAPQRDETGPDGAAFLQKPFSADSLGRKIRQMLSRA